MSLKDEVAASSSLFMKMRRRADEEEEEANTLSVILLTKFVGRGKEEEKMPGSSLCPIRF